METTRATVMIVDDNITNLKIAKNALADAFNVFTVPSAVKMFDMLERQRPDLILLDIDMPEMGGFEAIQRLKDNPETRDIPIIFLTGKSDPESELKGLSLGAIDYIPKPFVPGLLYKRVELHLTLELQRARLEAQTERLALQGEELQHFNRNLQKMVEEKTREFFELQGAIIRTVADLVESRDKATGGHVARTQHYLKALIDGLDDSGLYWEQRQEWDITLLLSSSQLHDVGKIAIKDSILDKHGPLTSSEFEIMKQHAALGVKIIERIETEVSDSTFLKWAKIFAETHHEKWDGSGYPKGLRGEGIPLPGRLMAIADVYDALISERAYKKAMPHEEAVAAILAGKGSHFDPVLVDVFERVAGRFAVSAMRGWLH